jgi:hypothetical protein
MDFDTDADITFNTPVSPGAVDGQPWRGYPEALFGNWKPDQVRRSKMLSNCSELDMCLVHWLDVLTDGTFTVLDGEGRDQTSRVTPERINEFWELLKTPVSCALLCVLCDDGRVVFSDLRIFAFVRCLWIIFPCLCCRCLERGKPLDSLLDRLCNL